MKKRLLSLLLVLVMLVGIVPFGARAAEADDPAPEEIAEVIPEAEEEEAEDKE